jgi:hypothetical protein
MLVGDVGAPRDWPSSWGLILRARLAPDESLVAGELFAPMTTPQERADTRLWVVWRCADGGLVRACDRRVSDVAWYDEYFIELDEGLSGDTGYALHVLRVPGFGVVETVRFELAPDDPSLAHQLVATELVVLGHPSLIAVGCDEPGQAACFDIIELRASPPRRLFTTPLMHRSPVGSRDGRWLCYQDHHDAGDGVRVALVDLSVAPPIISRHRLVVAAGVQMWWSDLKLAWDSSGRLTVWCPENTREGCFAWTGAFDFPLTEDMTLTRVPAGDDG